MFKIIKGFTMAEVLITLGILGVVIAMTLPAMIHKYDITATETRLKKFYSIFNQAILQSVAKNGPFDGWQYWNTDIIGEDGVALNRQEDHKKSFDLYLAPYLKIYKVEKLKYSTGDFAGEEFYMYYLADGSAFYFARHENRDIYFYPRNPEKCLNREAKGESTKGVCGFSFSFYPLRNLDDWKYSYKKGLEPFRYLWDGNINSLYENPTYGCNTEANGAYCTALIQQNGWKVPKNYPRRISY